MTFPIEKVRADFPVLTREVNGLPLAYLDSAASAQKPNQVIDAEAEFYRHGYAAVHRGIHTLSAQATEKMENVRKLASLFINARSAEELVFVRGTTEGIKHAIKTDGQMTNNNLLLGKLAEVDTKPQLEIYADDVKCSHGATVGRIDDEQMFYLRSRGIGQQDAQQMILYAFAAELTEALGEETLKQQVLARIAQRLPGGVA
ncbi:aminotransferase class V-fold PLP-dependent enzyme [Citrobacter braakii]